MNSDIKLSLGKILFETNDIDFEAFKIAGPTVSLNVHQANLSMGGHGQDGDINLKDKNGTTTISLSGHLGIDDDACIRADGTFGNLYLGNKGKDGDLMLTDEIGATQLHLSGGGSFFGHKKAAIQLNGQQAQLRLGGTKSAGSVVLRNQELQERIEISAGKSTDPSVQIRVDGDKAETSLQYKHLQAIVSPGGIDGDNCGLRVWDGHGSKTPRLRMLIGALPGEYNPDQSVSTHDIRAYISKEGQAWLGGAGHNGQLSLRNAEGKDKITLDTANGHILANDINLDTIDSLVKTINLLQEKVQELEKKIK